MSSETPTAVVLPDRAVLRLSGDEAVSFLQGLVTNDVEHVPEGGAVYAALLTPQGKFMFDFFVVRQGGDILLETSAARSADLLKRLTLYKLRAKIELSIDKALGVAAFWGAHTPPAEALAVYADPRHAGMGMRAILAPEGAADRLRQAGYAIQDETVYHQHRLSLGVGEAPYDVVPEKSFPLEVNFDEMNAVDFKKGCFVGQEVTSRTKRRGSVRKRLIPCRVNGGLPAPGSDVLAGERVVGTVYSGSEELGSAFALLRLDALEKAPLLASGVELHPEPQDWLNLAEAADAS